jgi:hypothetical protein
MRIYLRVRTLGRSYSCSAHACFVSHFRIHTQVREIQSFFVQFNSGRRRFKSCHFIWFAISACRNKSADVERNGDVFEVSGAAAARVRPVSARGHLFIKAMCLK